MTPTTLRRQYAAEAALVGGRHWRGTLVDFAGWLAGHAHVLGVKEYGRAEVRQAAADLLGELRPAGPGMAVVHVMVDEDVVPRPPGCQCQWEAGDSPCRVHGEDET